MLKFALSDPNIYRRLKRVPLLNRLLVLKIPSWHRLSTDDFCEHLGYLCMPNDVLKTTSRNRFADVDEITLQLMDKTRENIIHDVAISSGITSLELYSKLKKSGLRFKLNVSDRYSDCFVSGRYVQRIHSTDGRFIEGYLLFLAANEKFSTRFPISKFLGHLLNSPRSPTAKRILLYETELCRLVSEGVISEIRYDVFESDVRDTFTYVRSMNLLHRAYFTEEQLVTALRHLIASLKSNGILQIGRTENGTEINRVGFYRKTPEGLLLVKELNDGSDVTDLLERAGQASK